MDKKSIKGTETEKNLLKSFAGESQARGRYTIFAEVAQKEGYEQIAAIFLEMPMPRNFSAIWKKGCSKSQPLILQDR